MNAIDKALVRDMYAVVAPVAAADFKTRVLNLLRAHTALTPHESVVTGIIAAVEALPVTEERTR